jgi:uncharacterized repeat protein (TIGR01451 family)
MRRSMGFARRRRFLTAGLLAMALGLIWVAAAAADAPDGSDAGTSTLNGGPVNPPIGPSRALAVKFCGQTDGPPASVCTNNPNAVKVYVAGSWVWYTHGSDCNTDRAGAGVAVDWGDRADLTQPGNGNPVKLLTYKTSSGQTVTRYISVGVLATDNHGNSTDNVVHPTPRSTDKYGTWGTVDVTNPSLFKSWRGACGNVTSTQPKLPRGTWGARNKLYDGTSTSTLSGLDAQGLSHVFASSDDVKSICVVTYDVHPGTKPSGNTNASTGGGIPSAVGEITAGGGTRNSDNGVEKNSGTPLGNACPDIPIPRPHIIVEKKPHQQTVPLLGTALWTIVITNNGDTTLTNVYTTDALAANCAKDAAAITALTGKSSLAPGESEQYDCFLDQVAGAFTNVVVACGTGSGGFEVCDNAPATLDTRSGGVGLEDLSSNQDFVPNDTATLSGAINPLGKVTFTLHAGSCTGTTLFTSGPLSYTAGVGSGNTALLSALLATNTLGPDTSGTYYWDVAYSGDLNGDGTQRNAAFSKCTEYFTIAN